jgi:hypothetical protein
VHAIEKNNERTFPDTPHLIFIPCPSATLNKITAMPCYMQVEVDLIGSKHNAFVM